MQDNFLWTKNIIKITPKYSLETKLVLLKIKSIQINVDEFCLFNQTNINFVQREQYHLRCDFLLLLGRLSFWSLVNTSWKTKIEYFLPFEKNNKRIWVHCGLPQSCSVVVGMRTHPSLTFSVVTLYLPYLRNIVEHILVM
jgi:hypothetical protein